MKTLFVFLLLCAIVGVCTAKTYVVKASNNQFEPKTLTIEKGDTVRWEFLEGVHTTTSGSNCIADGMWDSGDMTASQTYDYRFASAGSFPYYCIHHCSELMTGTITVTGGATEIENQEKPSVINTLQNYPNPFINYTTFSFTASKAGKASLQISSLDGKVIHAQIITVKAGENILPVTIDLPSGMYLVKLDMNGIITRSRIIARKE